MCGIVGIVSTAGPVAPWAGDAVARMRQRMAHRGPDGAGLWTGPGAVLGHRRLAVIDLSEAGAQPMVSADGRWVIVYNGELYNDAELRVELAREGVRFRSASDTETIVEALARWGSPAIERLRGMYALAAWSTPARSLVLARDPLGIKPLYWARLGSEVAFASEIQALCAHPSLRPEPDLVTVSSYLTTIRTTLGKRTLFKGVSTLEPGARLVLGPGGTREFNWWDAHPPGVGNAPAAEVRACVADSVDRHLRSDVPTCVMLSGGLDSTIVAFEAARAQPGLSTYSSGAAEPGSGEDFEFARLASGSVGSRHAEAPVTRDLFTRRWDEMVDRLGLPLGTPNEVAINEVARRMRADGRIVTLSGEGADELFGGYEAPMTEAARQVAALGGCDGAWRGAGGEFQLASAAWVPLEAKGCVFRGHVWDAVGRDAALRGFYRAEFARLACGDPMQSHLRFHRRINLAGLLLRLDQATMLEGVEGRTPLADERVALLAEALPMERKFVPGVGTAGTKRVLREAYADAIPTPIVSRAKASFPLPFQGWCGAHSGVLDSAALARELFTDAARSAVAAQPGSLWRLAWPMINLALWGRRWWGDAGSNRPARAARLAEVKPS